MCACILSFSLIEMEHEGGRQRCGFFGMMGGKRHATRLPATSSTVQEMMDAAKGVVYPDSEDYFPMLQRTRYIPIQISFGQIGSRTLSAGHEEWCMRVEAQRDKSPCVPTIWPT